MKLLNGNFPIKAFNESANYPNMSSANNQFTLKNKNGQANMMRQNYPTLYRAVFRKNSTGSKVNHISANVMPKSNGFITAEGYPMQFSLYNDKP